MTKLQATPLTPAIGEPTNAAQHRRSA